MEGIGQTQAAGYGVLRRLYGAQEQQRAWMRRMAAGLRITRAAEGPAELAMSELMRAQIGGLGVEAFRTIPDQLSREQVREGGAAQIGDVLQRMRGLAVQASTGTLTTEQRRTIQAEMAQLEEQIGTVIETAEFSTQRVLEEERVSTAALGIAGLSVTTQAGAQAALQRIDTAIERLSGYRAEVGATTNVLERRRETALTTMVNTMAAESRIRDLDYARATMGLTRANVLEQMGLAMMQRTQERMQRPFPLRGFYIG